MGLKTTNYTVNNLGLTIPEAYARLITVFVDLQGHATGLLEVNQHREDIGVKRSLESYNIHCEVDKNLPIHRQIYNYAKENYLPNWDDDIIE